MRVYVVLLACLFAFSAHAQPEDAAAKQQMVERYFASFPVEENVREIATEIAKTMPENERAAFIDFMARQVDFSVIMAAAKKSFQTRFTLEELTALTEFMESPAGRSSMGKMKYYMADVMPVIQAEVVKALKQRETGATPAP